MDIAITPREGYVYVSVANRQGIPEAKDALQRIIDAIERAPDRRILIAVRESEAIFNVADYGLLDAVTRLAGIPGLKIALVADTDALLLSYRYVEAAAAQRLLEARAFPGEAQALGWLLA